MATIANDGDEDVITEYGDWLRFAYLAVVEVVAAVVTVFAMFGKGPGGQGLALVPAMWAFKYRRKWRRAVGLPLGPRWSKERV